MLSERTLVAAMALVVWVTVGLESPALAGSSYVDLKWSHPNPGNVTGFAVLLAAEKGDVKGAERVEVGLPLRDGIYRWSIRIPENEFVWVAVVAVGTRQALSLPSEWKRLDWDPRMVQLKSAGRPFLVEQPDP